MTSQCRKWQLIGMSSALYGHALVAELTDTDIIVLAVHLANVPPPQSAITQAFSLLLPTLGKLLLL